MDSKKFILGLGNPIIDISAETDQETLNKFELAAGQTIFCNDKNLPFYEYLESKPEVTYIPGGSVTNSIRVTNVKNKFNLILVFLIFFKIQNNYKILFTIIYFY
jgi:hypothetical protein